LFSLWSGGGKKGTVVKRFLWENSLALVTFSLFFLVFLLGQSLAGQRAYNDERHDHGESSVSYAAYVKTAHFGEATFENWESEFLQMGAYVVLTVWLRQKGSAESKSLDGDDDGEGDAVDEDPTAHRDDPNVPWPVRRGGIALTLYQRSLSLAFFTLFGLSWLLHAITGAHEYSSDQLQHGGEAVTTLQYVTRAQFWFESMQNWQSEFLAVAAIVILTIFLRQRGSQESKPVHASYAETGTS